LVPLVLEKYFQLNEYWIGLIIICGLMLIISWAISWLQDRTKKVKKNTIDIKGIFQRLDKIEDKMNVLSILHDHDKKIELLKQKVDTNEKIYKPKK
jgi:hypothetical protein